MHSSMHHLSEAIVEKHIIHQACDLKPPQPSVCAFFFPLQNINLNNHIKNYAVQLSMPHPVNESTLKSVD